MAMQINVSSDGEQMGIAGKIFASLIFLVFAAFGVGFTVLIAKSAFDSTRPYFWQQVPCTIVECNLNEVAGEQAVKCPVKYVYEFAGTKYSSTVNSSNKKVFESADRADVTRYMDKFKVGTETVCIVNPSHPEESVLQQDSLWGWFGVLFPLVFLAVGAGGIYWIWRAGKAKGPVGASGTGSISAAASGAAGYRVIFLFFSVFFLMGSAFMWVFFVGPVLHMYAARNWVEVPCTVISSQVRSHSSDDGPTYSVDILYSYEVGGRQYKSNRYGFVMGSSSGHDGKQRIVDAYPPGRRAVCYVDPQDPAEAALSRSFSSDMLFGLIPLVFIIVGAGGMVYAVRLKRNAGKVLPAGQGLPAPAKSRVGPGAGTVPEGGMEPLKSKGTPVGKFFGAVFVALFWNGIVSVFVTQAVQGWRSGNGDWFLTLFMVPFVLIGLGIIGGVFYQFLAMFNPRPRFRVNSRALQPGAEMLLKWEMSGCSRLREFSIFLEGREEATYRRGTTTSTDKQVFSSVLVFKSQDPREMSAGSVSCLIPADAMHSFEAPNNKIIWALRVEGDIVWWPDVKEEFPFVVLPGQTAEGRA